MALIPTFLKEDDLLAVVTNVSPDELSADDFISDFYGYSCICFYDSLGSTSNDLYDTDLALETTSDFAVAEDASFAA